jgi:sugar phosphate permease
LNSANPLRSRAVDSEKKTAQFNDEHQFSSSFRTSNAMPAARWVMIFMCCLANTINYIDRANLAVAAPVMQRELGFDAATMGFVLGGFFWTYAFMQMPFG